MSKKKKSRNLKDKRFTFSDFTVVTNLPLSEDEAYNLAQLLRERRKVKG